MGRTVRPRNSSTSCSPAGLTGQSCSTSVPASASIHLALLEAGASRAVDVDASRDYLAAAREEATRRNLDDRVDYHYGDVVEIAAELPPADVVILDSVICCYPYLPTLLEAAVRSRPRLIGLTYPRDVWWMRTFMRRVQRNARAGAQPRAVLHLPTPNRTQAARRGRLRRGPRRRDTGLARLRIPPELASTCAIADSGLGTHR